MAGERDTGFRPTDQQMLINSWNQNIGVWLRNLDGANFGLKPTIRHAAEVASIQRRPLRVLEVTNDLPLKSLDLRSKGFRQRGDMLVYGEKGPHPRPEIQTTIVTRQDMTSSFLEGKLQVIPQDAADLLTRYLLPGLDITNRYITEETLREGRAVGRAAYRNLTQDGDVTILANDSPLQLLERLKEAGTRFDLAFLDPHSLEDKLSSISAVQSLLSLGGVAYVPVEWWSPHRPTHGSGIERYRIWHETRTGDRGVEDLEDYLAREYPTAYEIAPFPGAKTLIIKGTSDPVSSM